MKQVIYTLLLSFLGIFICCAANAQIISTYAGTGTPGYSGDDSAATSAKLYYPNSVAVDAAGNLYIGDQNNDVVRKVNPSGIITTFAGGGTSGLGDGGLATAAEFESVRGIAVDGSGNVYIGDGGNRVRKVSPSGIITTVAGNGGTGGFSGDGGLATAAQLYGPNGVAVDTAGNLYISDFLNSRIRKVTPSGMISTIAGGGSVVVDGGMATAIYITEPEGVAVDSAGNVYIANVGMVSKVTPLGIFHKVAGDVGSGFAGDGGPATASLIDNATSVALDRQGNVIFADGNRIRKVNSSGIISTIAGDATGLYGFSGDGGPATATLLRYVEGVTIGSNGDMYIADYENQRIRMVNCIAPVVTTITGLNSVCTGGTITLTDTTSGGVWSSTSSIATVSGGTVTGMSAGVDTIKYSVTNSCGTATATMVVTVNGTPSVSPLTGPSNVCVGASVPLADVTTGGTWSATNTNATVSSTGSVTGAVTGIDTIKYSVTGTCGTTVVTKTITINALPAAGAISGASSTVCVGSTITFTDPAPGGTWSVSNSAVAIVSGGAATGIAPGVDTILYSVTNSCGTATATKIVTVTLSATVSPITGAPVVCVGASVTLADATTGGAWTVSNAHASIAGSTVTGVSGGIDTVIYSVTTTCGIATATMAVTVNPLPTVSAITGLSGVCVGSSISLADVTAGGTWSVTNTTAAVTGTGGVTGASAGVDTIKYAVTNSCGTTTVSKTVTINTAPSAGSITGSATVCIGASVPLADVAPAGTWTATNGRATVTGAGSVTGVSAGTDTIVYTVTNACGTAAATHIITISTTLSAGTVTGLSSVCAGASITLADAVTGGTWSATNATATVTGGTVTGVSAGADTIIYSITSTCGTATATKTITINPAPSAGTISGPSGVCIGASVTLTDPVTGGTWSATNASASVSAGVVAGATAGTDTIKYAVTNGCGTAIATQVITISAAPSAGIISGPDTVCTGSSVTLTDPVPGGTWSSSAAGTATVSSGIVTGLSSGTAAISYSVTNACSTANTANTIYVAPCALSTNGYAGSISESTELKVYPNPNLGMFTVNLISANDFDAIVVITNVVGEKVKEFNIVTNKAFDVKLAPSPGIYFLSVSAPGGRYVAKVIVE